MSRLPFLARVATITGVVVLGAFLLSLLGIIPFVGWFAWLAALVIVFVTPPQRADVT